MTDDTDPDPLSTGAALEVLAELSAQTGQALIGRELGGYRITGLIAEGGMSRVYRAIRIDGSFERDVAVKISPGSGFSQDLRDRFLREQTVLAGLNHPNISQLYDAQVTDEGWPYIVMELVDGEPIDAWCRERASGARDVVRLMIGITDALAYAHARLIVHRDIKPSNVLVTAEGRPKVVDFGIAKLLEPDVRALTRMSPMTPRYASPELLLGSPVTIASDIYQLGLLLYRLLTGEALSPDETAAEAIRRAADGKPLALDAAARRKLPRELALVIEQCLRVAPDERYPDANALKRDLESWLGGFAVTAAGQGRGYRLRKFVGRNLPATMIAAIATIAIIAGSAWYTWSLTEARELAERRAETSNHVLQAMSQLISDTFSGLVDANAARRVGSTAHIESVLTETVALMQRELAAEPGAQAELLRVQGAIELVLGDNRSAAGTLAQAYARIDAAESPLMALQILLDRIEAAARNTDVDTMRAMLIEADAIVEAHAFHPRMLARYHHQAGQVLQFENEYEPSIAEFEKALRLLEDAGSGHERLLAETHYEIAFSFSRWGRHEEALAAARRAVALLEKTENAFTHRLVHPLRQVGWSSLYLGDFAAARAAYERAMAIARANFGELHSTVGAVHDSLGALAYHEQRFDDAIRHFEDYIHILREVEGEDSKNLLVPYANTALIAIDTGRMAKAGQYHRLLLDTLDPAEPDARRMRFTVLSNEGRRLFATGDHDAAAERYAEALVLARELFDAGSEQTINTQRSLAMALLRAGRVEDARREYREQLALYGERHGTDGDDYAAWSLASWQFDLADGELDAARRKLEQRAREKVEADELGVIYWADLLAELASICLRQDDLPCARQALDWTAPGIAVAPEHPWAYYARVVEAEYWEKRGDGERARELAREAYEGLSEKYPLHVERIERAARVAGI